MRESQQAKRREEFRTELGRLVFELREKPLIKLQI